MRNPVILELPPETAAALRVLGMIMAGSAPGLNKPAPRPESAADGLTLG